MHEWAAKVDEYARGMISGSGSTLFEELGLYYIGPVDGHNIDDLLAILKEVESTKTTGPVLIHVVTEKGRGYPYAEKAADKYHGNRGITNFFTFINMIHQINLSCFGHSTEPLLIVIFTCQLLSITLECIKYH